MKELLLDINDKLEKLYGLDNDYEINNFKNKIDKKLKVIEYKEKYDIDLREKDFHRLDWVFIKRYYGNIYIGKGMKVLNSEKQPKENEMLFQFAYPTGAYIFGGSGWCGSDCNYDEKTFDEFFEELKTYNYKYIDDLNNCLYFSMENGAKLFNKYQEICEKYQNIWNKRAKEKKKEELEQQLKDLEKVD